MGEKYKEKIELPVFVVAVLIFLASLGFLGFALYYIAFLPVPMNMQPLRIRILTALQVEDANKEMNLENKEESLFEENNNNYELEN